MEAHPTFIIAAIILSGFAVVEKLAGGRNFPTMRWWKARGIAATVVFLSLGLLIPNLIALVQPRFSLLELGGRHLALQIFAGMIVTQGCLYAWHRAAHAVPWFWEWSHKEHHRVTRVDVWGAFYFHPGDMVTLLTLQALVLIFIVSVSPEAAVAITGANIFLSVFQHVNMRTPWWLGYIVTRPEAHCVHHEKGVHRFNYGDIPLFDILFGTYRNPKEWEKEAGF